MNKYKHTTSVYKKQIWLKADKEPLPFLSNMQLNIKQLCVHFGVH